MNSSQQTVLSGPYDLTYDAVEKLLPRSGGGVFALGYVDGSDLFRVQRVGRAGSDLRAQLQALIGSGNKFKYKLTATEKEAFELECTLFHKLRPPSNISHPDRPRDSGWRCPHCLQHHR